MKPKRFKMMATKPVVHRRFKAEAGRQQRPIGELHDEVLTGYVERQAAKRKRVMGKVG